MNQQLIEIDATALDAAATSISLDKIEQLPRFQRAITLAAGIQKLRGLISGKTLEVLTGLAGTSLGFKTDRDGKDGYPPAVIRDALIEGIIRGASPVGNEINIISGRCYLTKEYYERRLSEMEGLTNLEYTLGMPMKSPSEEWALVPADASWVFDGVKCQSSYGQTENGDTRIPCRIYKDKNGKLQDSIDLIHGKAKRKLLARIYARCTGSQWAAEEAERDEVVIDTTATPRIEPVAEWRKTVAPELVEIFDQCTAAHQIDAQRSRLMQDWANTAEKRDDVMIAVAGREMELVKQ